MKIAIAVFIVVASLTNCGAATNEPVIGGPCEGCEAVFVDMPQDIPSSARIAPTAEKGQALVLEGIVRNSSGKAVSGIIVYAYHTNAGGIYPRSSTQHGALRGWARTDSQGHYRFETIRPGSYPSTDNPQHIHMHVIEPGKGTYYIDEVVFHDDPLLTPDYRQRMRQGRGGYGDANPQRDAKGVWHVQRDIVLGANIPGYPD